MPRVNKRKREDKEECLPKEEVVKYTLQVNSRYKITISPYEVLKDTRSYLHITDFSKFKTLSMNSETLEILINLLPDCLSRMQSFDSSLNPDFLLNKVSEEEEEDTPSSPVIKQ